MNDELVQKLVVGLANLIKYAEEHHTDHYWYGQLTATLDAAGIDIYEFVEHERIVPFVSEETL